MESLAVLILAAGLGKRMKSDLPKVVATTCDKPMIHHVLETASSLNPERIVVVTGHKKEVVVDCITKGAKTNSYDISKIQYADQLAQLGTGDAVKSALPALESFTGTVLILYGDTPLVSPKTLSDFLKTHASSSSVLSLITVNLSEANAYGRIIRDPNSKTIQSIVEAKDCSPAELSVTEVNSGIYAVESTFLRGAVTDLKNDNAQGEYYLTDIVGAAVSEKLPVATYSIHSMREVQGVNDLYDMSLVNRTIMEERVKALLKSGVYFEMPDTVSIDAEVTIGAGTKIGPNVQIRGKSSIGSGCVIEGTAFIQDSRIADNVHIKLCVRMEKAVVGNDSMVGPFAHLRPDAVLDEDVKVGNFVEVKKSHLKKGAKASHLTYLGDATVGKDANIGAGTITCNYDGYKKSETIIGAGVFIGSNSSLVAPVTIEDGATVGAGSVITKRVEKDSLAITRSPLITKAGWSKKKRG